VAGLRRRLARVRAASVAGGVVALLAALLVGRLVVGPGATVQALTAGAVLAGGVYALNSDRPPVRMGGVVLLLPGGLLVAASLGAPAAVAARSAASALAVLAVVVAVGTIGLVAALSGTTAPDEGQLGVANSRATRALLGPLVLFLALVLPDLGLAARLAGAAGGVVGVVLGHLLGDPPTLAPFVFPVLLAAAAFLARRALRGIPVDAVVRPERRAAVTDRLAAVERGLTWVVVVAVGLLFALALLTAVGGSPDLAGLRAALPPAVADLVVGAVTTPLLRLPLLVVAGIALVATELYRLYSLVRGASPGSLARRFAAPLGGLLAAAVVATLLTASGVAVATRRRLLDAVGPGVFDLLAGFGPTVLAAALAGLVLLVAVLALRTLGLVVWLVAPPRAVAPALAGLASFVLAAVALVVGATALAFGTAALAVVAWDVGEYGRGLGEELLADARTTRAELTHAGGSLAVGIAAVLTALGLATLLGSTTALPSTVALAALVLAVGAAVLLLYSL
jgi:hypothetical protein